MKTTLSISRSETTLQDCPPGLFVFGESIGFKTEYNGTVGPHAYCVESGEYFWGGTNCAEDRRKLIVRPAFLKVIDEPWKVE